MGEVVMAMQEGLKIVHDYVDFQIEAAEAFAVLAGTLLHLSKKGAKLKSDALKSPHLAKATFLSVFDGFGKFFETAGKQAEILSDELKSSCLQPITENLPNLTQQMNQLARSQNTHKNPTGGKIENFPKVSSKNANNRKIERHLAIARRELEEAEASKEDLINAFGSNLNPKLKQGVDTRIEVAQHTIIKYLNNLAELQPNNVTLATTPPVELSLITKQKAVTIEAEGLDWMICCLKRSAQALKVYQREESQAYVSLSLLLDGCNPIGDAELWGFATFGSTFHIDKSAFRLQSNFKVSGNEETLKEMPPSAKEFQSISERESMFNWIKEQTKEIHRLKEELADTKRQQKLREDSTQKRNYMEEKSTLFNDSKRLSGGAKGRLQDEVQTGMMNTLQLPALKPKERLTSSSEDSPLPSSSAEFSYFERITANLDSSVSLDKQWWQLQRHYEEFLLKLKDIGSINTDSNWDSLSFFNGFEMNAKLDVIFPSKSFYFLKASRLKLLSLESNNGLFTQENRILEDQHWSYIAYEILLLCYQHLTSFFAMADLLQAEETETVSVSPHPSTKDEEITQIIEKQKSLFIDRNWELKQTNLKLVRDLIGLYRIKIGLPSRISRLIIDLTLINGDDMGHWTSLHPLDIRFRVLRLLDSWQRDDCGLDGYASPLSSNSEFTDWIYRQICFVNHSLCLRFSRFEKFYIVALRAEERSSLSTAKERRLQKKLIQMMNCFKTCDMNVGILLDLCQSQQWGSSPRFSPSNSLKNSTLEVYDGRSVLVNLLKAMTRLEALDASLRQLLATSVEKNSKNPPVMAASLDGEKSSLDRFVSTLLGSTETQKSPPYSQTATSIVETAILPIELLLSPYWSYDVSTLQIVLVFLFQCCMDSENETKLNENAVEITQGLLVANQIIQWGTDAFLSPGKVMEGVDYPGVGAMPLSLETLCLLLVQALWISEINDFEKKFVNFSFDGSKTISSHISIVTVEFAETLLMLLNNFSKFLCDTSFNISHRIQELEDVGEGQSFASLSTPPPSISSQFSQRVALFEQHSLLPLQTIMGKTLSQPWRTLDWRALTLNEIQNIFVGDSFHAQKLYFPEEQTEGHSLLSLLLPSRIERVISEFILRRLVITPLRRELIEILGNYRLHMDYNSLPVLLKVWETIETILLTNNKTSSIEEERPSPLSTSSKIFYPQEEMFYLPDILKGPTRMEDFYRYFIFSSVSKLFQRTCGDAIDRIRTMPHHLQEFKKFENNEEIPEELLLEANNEMAAAVEACGEVFIKFIDEVKCEIEFFTPVWSKILSAEEHLTIVTFAGRREMIQAVRELIISPYWSSKSLPAGASSILTTARQFELLSEEILSLVNFAGRGGTNLFNLFKPFIHEALDERLQMVGSIVERCLSTEAWKPLLPPDALHSGSCVDMLSFVHHLYDYILEMHAPVNWVLPTFIQFLIQLSSSYSERLIQDTLEGPIAAVKVMVESHFGEIRSPKERTAVPMIFSRKRRSNLYKDMKGIIKAFRPKHSTRGSTTITKESLRMLPSKPKMEGGDSETATFTSSIAGEESGDEESNSVHQKGKKSIISKKWTSKFLRTSAGIGQTDISQQKRISDDITLLLERIKSYQVDLIIPTWIVRLHNLEYFCWFLPSLVKKFEGELEKSEKENQSLCITLQQTLSLDVTKRSKNELPSPEVNCRNVHLNLVGEGGATIGEMLGGAIESCKNLLREGMLEVCKYLAARSVFMEFQTQIFSDLYSNDFVVPTLTDLINSFSDSIEKLFVQVPLRCNLPLVKYFILYLLQSWYLLIAEMGFEGHVYTYPHVEILMKDLQFLRMYIKKHCKVTDAPSLTDPLTQEVLEHQCELLQELFEKLETNGRLFIQLTEQSQFVELEDDKMDAPVPAPAGALPKSNEVSVSVTKDTPLVKTKGKEKNKLKQKFPKFFIPGQKV